MIKAMDALEVLELHRIEAQQQILANGALAERSLLERQARLRPRPPAPARPHHEISQAGTSLLKSQACEVDDTLPLGA